MCLSKPEPPLEADSEIEGLQSLQLNESVNIGGPLECLPPELRLHLLLMLDFDELKALVHASPVYHAQYCEDQMRILCMLLEEWLGTVTVDALFVINSSSFAFQLFRNRGRVGQLFRDFKAAREIIFYSNPRNHPTLDDASRIFNFHRRIIKPLARQYASWALGNLSRQTGRPQSPASLSWTEEILVLRALYQFQLMRNLRGSGNDATPPSMEHDGLLSAARFVTALKPWEDSTVSTGLSIVTIPTWPGSDQFQALPNQVSIPSPHGPFIRLIRIQTSDR